MAKKPTLTATLPDGKTATRQTFRPYTHIVALCVERSDGTRTWSDIQWSLSEKNAQKAAFKNGAWWSNNLGKKMSDGSTWLEYRVLPVNSSAAPDVPVTPVISAPDAVCPECGCACRHTNTRNDSVWGETYSYRCLGCSREFALSFPSSEVTAVYAPMPAATETIRAAELEAQADGAAHFWYCSPDGNHLECDGIVRIGNDTYRLFAKDSGDTVDVAGDQILWVEYQPKHELPPRSLRTANLATQHEYAVYVGDAPVVEFNVNVDEWRRMVSWMWASQLRDVEALDVLGQDLIAGDLLVAAGTRTLYKLIEPLGTITSFGREMHKWKVLSINTPRQAEHVERFFSLKAYRVLPKDVSITL